MVPGRHVSYPAPPFENTATWRDVAEKACAIIAEQSRGFLQCPDLVAHFPSTAWISSDPWLKQAAKRNIATWCSQSLRWLDTADGPNFSRVPVYSACSSR
eukprot:570148-Pyramimonas_sp.AAC.1